MLARGHFASLDLSGTGEALNSDFEYIRMFGQFNLYRPIKRLSGRRVHWAQSLRLGLADSFDQQLDRVDRFFAGGQYSVRGYPTNSLGPVLELGDDLVYPAGGKTLLVINEELRFDLLGPVAGLVFFDLGNVWEDTAEFSSDLFKSVGLGLRAVTPVGLLRLDLAFPLDRREMTLIEDLFRFWQHLLEVIRLADRLASGRLQETLGLGSLWVPQAPEPRSGRDR